jgi:hypothetical protein
MYIYYIKIFILLLILFFFLLAFDHLDKFQELCGSTHLPSLKNLHFSFCFPQEMEHAWRTNPFNCNSEWPFDNIGYYIDETLVIAKNGIGFVTETLLIIYRRPINVLLQHKRTLHNHHFATHASLPIITTQRRSLELTCDRMGDPIQVVKTLQVIASSHLKKLHLTYPHELVSDDCFLFSYKTKLFDKV